MKPINYKKSIETEKLIFHQSSFERITYWFFKLLFPTIIIIYTLIIFDVESSNNNYFKAYSVLILGSVFAFFYVIIILKNNNLKIIKGFEKSSNKYKVNNYIKNKNWGIVNKEKNYFILLINNKYSGLHNGRYLHILFDKSNILINSTAVDVFGEPISFHWFGNRKIEDDFIKEFQFNE